MTGRRFSPDKLVAYGMGLAAVAAAVGVAIWASDTKGGLTRVPVLGCAVACALGISIATVGLFMKSGATGSGKMSQTAGANSVQTQAGRDVVDTRYDKP